jgi:nicotinate phosphoribosyltransferase
MAHSWVQSFPSERAAFETFAREFPGHVTLLVDTYDTVEGVQQAARIEPPVQGVRIDSGDLSLLSRDARAILDGAGRPKTRVIASGDLDERKIDALLRDGAPIDGFGIGTELITSRDAPALAMVYKLVEVNGQGRLKLSPGKKSYPLRKQIFRQYDASGTIWRDIIARHDEALDGEPLLVPVVRGGQLVASLPGLETLRKRVRDDMHRLPHPLRSLDHTTDAPVSYSQALEDAAIRLAAGLH